METKPKYKVINTYPSSEKGEFYMADYGYDDHSRYYIVSTQGEPKAKEFADMVVDFLNSNSKDKAYDKE